MPIKKKKPQKTPCNYFFGQCYSAFWWQHFRSSGHDFVEKRGTKGIIIWRPTKCMYGRIIQTSLTDVPKEPKSSPPWQQTSSLETLRASRLSPAFSDGELTSTFSGEPRGCRGTLRLLWVRATLVAPEQKVPRSITQALQGHGKRYSGAAADSDHTPVPPQSRKLQNCHLSASSLVTTDVNSYGPFSKCTRKLWNHLQTDPQAASLYKN